MKEKDKDDEGEQQKRMKWYLFWRRKLNLWGWWKQCGRRLLAVPSLIFLLDLNEMKGKKKQG